MHLGNLTSLRQHVAPLFRQRDAVFDPFQPDPLRHEFFRIPLAVNSHFCCCRCHVSCDVHPDIQDPGRLGPR